MAKLYVGNASKQQQALMYRVPEYPSPRTQVIREGRQVLISGDLSTLQVNYIIEQLERYGAVNADDISANKEFAGICYSVDKPITVAKIEKLIERNTTILVDRGAEMRREAAIAVHAGLERSLQESRIPGRLKELDMSFVEEEPRGGYRAENGPPVGEGIIVDREAPGPRTEQGRGRRRRAA